jgi:hypothetical protein
MLFLNDHDVQYLMNSRRADWRRATHLEVGTHPDVRTRVRAAWRGFRDPSASRLDVTR